jgi:eukaryotic-like serine/threonine-protein kinase
MHAGEILRGYKIIDDFSTTGAGSCKWTFAEKDGKTYFLKEFLSPTFPADRSPGSAETKKKKLERCRIFEQRHRKIFMALRHRCPPGCNVVLAQDFFREGAKYYAVTEKIDSTTLSIEEIVHLPLGARILLLKTLAHSVGILHQQGVVHGDLKLSNVLIKRSATPHHMYFAKLIDLDSSYLSNDPPNDSEDLIGDQVFASPEVIGFIVNDDRFKHTDLGLPSDVFSLGVLFCIYLTGVLPEALEGGSRYPGEAAMNGVKLLIKHNDLPPSLVFLVNSMLGIEHTRRPTVKEVLHRLRHIEASLPFGSAASPGGLFSGYTPSEVSVSLQDRAQRTRLRGSLMRKEG